MCSYDWFEVVKFYEFCEGVNLVFLLLFMFCKEFFFVVVFVGVIVLSKCFGGFGVFFYVDFIEVWIERKKIIVKDENSIYWKGV